MVTLTIDNRTVTVPEGTTILDAARAADIYIPTLCYLQDINEVASCRICAVEVEGVDKLATACNTLVEEGMVVHTNTQRVRVTRKTNVELILSQHVDHCVTCVRSGNCSLQKLSKLGQHPAHPPGQLQVHQVPAVRLRLRAGSVPGGVGGHRLRRPHHRPGPPGPADEQSRLRLLRPVRGPLPCGRSPGAG